MYQQIHYKVISHFLQRLRQKRGKNRNDTNKPHPKHNTDTMIYYNDSPKTIKEAEMNKLYFDGDLTVVLMIETVIILVSGGLALVQ